MDYTIKKTSSLNEMDLSALDGLDDDALREFARTKLGLPEEATLPENWQDVASLPYYADGLEYSVEFLQGGVALGQGWKAIKETFNKDIRARARAYEKTRDTGLISRVLVRTKGRKLVPVCIFYEENDKRYIAVQLEDGRTLRQEIRHPLDAAGGKLEEVCLDLSGNEK